MGEDDSDEKRRDTLLLTSGIVLLSVLIIAADGLYPLLAADYDVQLPLWMAVGTPIALIIAVTNANRRECERNDTSLSYRVMSPS